MIGWIIILMRATNALAERLEARGELRGHEADDDA
jgi:hypothetical protein